MKTGAHILVETLIEQGVDTIFGYPGGTVLPIFDALYEHKDRLRLIVPTHEQGGAHGADAYARVSGKTGVVLATSGPGATNLVTGIANAYMDSIPMVALTGNVSLGLIGRDSFQEIDIQGITIPITKHNYIVQDISLLAKTIQEAFVIAHSGRPGPVLVDIPKDIAAALTDYVPVGRYIPRPCPLSSEIALRLAAGLLGKSCRPLLLCGGGVVAANAGAEFMALMETLNAPAAATLMGLGAVPADHPLMLGFIGMHGSSAANFAAERADLLLCVGTRFSDRVAGDRNRFAPRAKLIHIDIDPSEFDKNVICDISLPGDARSVLQELHRLCTPLCNKPWQQDIQGFIEQHKEPGTGNGNGNGNGNDNGNGSGNSDGSSGLEPRQMLRCLFDLAGKDAVIVTDVGQHQMWTAQYYPFSRPRQFITSGGLGAMGFGMGAALGAKAAAPRRPVILITGDGSFHMNMTELSTSVTEQLPVTVIVMNNGVLGMVRQWQSMFYDGRHMGTTLGRPTNFTLAAKAFGALGYEVTTMEAFRSALQAALDSGQTAVLDCAIHPDEKVFPMIPPGKSGKDILYSDSMSAT